MRPKNSFRLAWTVLTRQQEVQASAVTLFKRSTSDAWSAEAASLVLDKFKSTEVCLESPNTESQNIFSCLWKNASRLQTRGHSWQREFVVIYPNIVSSGVPTVRLLFFHPTTALSGGSSFLNVTLRYLLWGRFDKLLFSSLVSWGLWCPFKMTHVWLVMVSLHTDSF